MTAKIKADLMLLLVTLFWGVSYLLLDISLDELEPFTLSAARFLLAFLVAAMFTFKRLIKVNFITLKYSLLLGFILLIVYIGSTFGVKYTSLSNAGFLSALAVIITPVLSLVFFRHVPSKKLIITVMICIIGIALLTLNEKLKPEAGDLLCIMCAFAYAIHLIVTERAVKKVGVNAFQLGVFQLGFTGLFNLILAAFIETPALPETPKVWFSVLFLAVFCTGLSFIVQVIAQQYTNASHVGVIFTLEPVFAGLVAYFIAGEVLTAKSYVGASLLVSSILIMEIDFGRLFNRKLSGAEEAG